MLITADSPEGIETRLYRPDGSQERFASWLDTDRGVAGICLVEDIPRVDRAARARALMCPVETNVRGWSYSVRGGPLVKI